MAQQVGEEGDAEQKLYEKFMCYCKTTKADLQKSVAANGAKLPAMETDIAQSQATVAKLKEDLKVHDASFSSAKASIAAANVVREKEHKEYLVESTERREYVDALVKAVPALANGKSGTQFMQTNLGVALSKNIRKAAALDPQLLDDDRQAVLSFMSMEQAGEDEVQASPNEIMGILSKMKEDFEGDLAEVEEKEAKAVAIYKELVGAKVKESKGVGKNVQKKTSRAGELAVTVVNTKRQAKSVQAMLDADSKLLENLKKECAEKEAGQEERDKMRADEMVSIHQAIQILDADDSKDLFKDTLAPAGSLLQVTGQVKSVKALLERVYNSPSSAKDRPEVRFLEMALEGKKVDFSKVAQLIDDMVALMGREQDEDETKKDFCTQKINEANGKAAELAKAIKDSEAAIDETSETLKEIKEEQKGMQKQVEDLDRIVADATAQRKSQNQDFTALMTANTGSQQVIQAAITRLQEFFAPKEAKKVALAKKAVRVAKALPAWADTASAKLASDDTDYFSGVSRDKLFDFLDKRPVGIAAFYQVKYQAKTAEANKVVLTLQQLVSDLDLEMKLATKDEERDQAAYQDLMEDSSEKRAAYLKSMNHMLGNKAENEELKAKQDGERVSAKKEHKGVIDTKGKLHEECDWLMQNFDLRRTARADEMNQLKSSKSILQGADFSLVQAKSQSLRGA